MSSCSFALAAVPQRCPHGTPISNTLHIHFKNMIVRKHRRPFMFFLSSCSIVVLLFSFCSAAHDEYFVKQKDGVGSNIEQMRMFFVLAPHPRSPPAPDGGWTASGVPQKRCRHFLGCQSNKVRRAKEVTAANPNPTTAAVKLKKGRHKRPHVRTHVPVRVQKTQGLHRKILEPPQLHVYNIYID